MVSPGQSIAVWFSCGAASAVAAKKTIEKYGDIATIRVVNNPVIEEHEDNLRFLKDVENWLGVKIEYATNKDYPLCSAKDVWARRKYMSGIGGAPCTMILKKQARQQWEENNKIDWHVLGFTYEEKGRSDRFMKTERDNLLPVLIDAELTKQDCIDIIRMSGIMPPIMYELGYPNANCIGCVKATSATYWNHVRKAHPEVFLDRAQQSKELGVKLVRHKGKRIFLEDLPESAKGNKLKSTHIECGIFCEEKL